MLSPPEHDRRPDVISSKSMQGLKCNSTGAGTDPGEERLAEDVWEKKNWMGERTIEDGNKRERERKPMLPET